VRAALAAEWLKLRTMRATLIGGLVVVLAVAGAAALVSYGVGVYDGLEPARRSQFALSRLEPVVALVAQIALGVVAVLVMATEHREGTLRLTLTVTPRRYRLAAAKTAVAAVPALLLGGGAVLATFAIGHALVGDRDIQVFTDPPLSTPAVLVANALAVPMITVTAVGLAMWLRSTAASVTTVVMIVFVLPMLAQAVPDPAGRWIRSVQPAALADQAAWLDAAYSVYGDALPPWAAIALMVAYPVVSVAVGALVLARRDA
jgi:hypothetical protein